MFSTDVGGMKLGCTNDGSKDPLKAIVQFKVVSPA
jgi:hypothetical protein